MPFVAGTKCRIWSAVNQKFLVAKKDGTEGNGSSKSQLKITCAGKEDEDASKVEALEVEDAGSGSVLWHLVFTLNSRNYALHVNSDDNTVTAKEFTGDKPPAGTTYFVPKKVAGPFEAFVVGSDENKRIAVNTQDNSLTVKNSDDTQQSTFSFVISNENI